MCPTLLQSDISMFQKGEKNMFVYYESIKRELNKRLIVVYYESLNPELKTKPINECR